MPHIKHLKCRECGATYPESPQYVCEECFGPLEVEYDYDKIREIVSRDTIAGGPLNMWRYRDLLPADGENITGTDTGFTPLIHARNLGRRLGLDNLYLKNDCVNPSYSFKDRVVSTAIAKAVEFGYDTIGCASTGNLANSVAALAARAGLKAIVFLPSDLEAAKVLASSVYGPTVVAVRGNYDEVNRLCSMLADQHDWAFVNVNVRPYYSEGAKTLGYEVAEQLGWRAPNHVFVPMASGSLFVKIMKGLREFQMLGLISEVPTKAHGAQARGCSPIVTSYEAGRYDVQPVKPNTICRSLAIGNPADGFYALQVMEQTRGSGVAVTDPEILEGIKLLARTEGILGETAAGTTIAALKKVAEAGGIGREETVVAYLTGNGLKTQIVLEGHVDEVLTIDPTPQSFANAYGAYSRDRVMA